jgi:hypothetical protein
MPEPSKAPSDMNNTGTLANSKASMLEGVVPPFPTYNSGLRVGRILRDDKKGYIPAHLPDILTRLNIDPRHWVYLTKDFESPFKSLVGSAYKIRQVCEQMGRNWVHGVKRCAEVFPDT